MTNAELATIRTAQAQIAAGEPGGMYASFGLLNEATRLRSGNRHTDRRAQRWLLSHREY